MTARVDTRVLPQSAHHDLPRDRADYRRRVVGQAERITRAGLTIELFAIRSKSIATWKRGASRSTASDASALPSLAAHGRDHPTASGIRVLHVSEVHWGGVVSLIRQFSAGQASAGHEVHLLAPAAFPHLCNVTKRDWRIARGKIGTYAAAVTDLRRAIKQVRPDVIHLHSFMAGLFGRLPLLDIAQGVPVVYQPHAWSFELLDNAASAAMIRQWERYGGRHTQLLAGNCSDEINEGRRVGLTCPAQVLGVAVDADYFTPVNERTKADYRRQLGLRAPRILLSLGRLARQKGQDLLVKAWEADPIPDTELAFVGPGDWSSLRELAPAQWGRTIRTAGDQTDVRPWLWACDMLVLPSRYETIAVVVAEAMACGRPVISTQVNGAYEAIAAGPAVAAGAVVPLGATNELILECTRRFEDPELYQHEARQARLRAETLFRPELVISRLATAYERAVRQGRSQ